MSVWYYVDGREKVGPVEQDEIINLVKSGLLNEKSYIWTKGFENWVFMEEVETFKPLFCSSEITALPPEEDDIPEFIAPEFSWDSVDYNKKIFTIKIGADRGSEMESEYGPYSLNFIKELMDANRITPKTYIFTPGLDRWIFIADIPIYESLFANLPPTITDQERRRDTRRPFVARIFFHDNEAVFDGVCRDISVGGMQILVSDAQFKAKDVISLNVHPENSEYGFVASGEVIRLLEGGQGFSIRFRELSPEAQQAIEKYVNEA